MQFLTLLLATVAMTLSLVGLASARDPPYCTPTGPGYCNLGWEYDTDVRLFHNWVYDHNCKQIGWHANPGFWNTRVPADLPNELWVLNTETGPIFSYGDDHYSRGTCWYTPGRFSWIHVAQCAFKC